MKNFYKNFRLFLLLILIFLTGCSSTSDTINAISREQGSGTRSAFTELFGLEKSDGEEKEDTTKEDSEITNSTAIVLQTTSGDKNAIGYVSIGALNDSVKALDIDSVKPSVENISSGSYPIYRPFLIVTQKDTNEIIDDFIGFVLSKDGQQIIEAENYVPINKEENGYLPKNLSGKLTISGSSSVTPVMETLVEAYEGLNKNVEIELQQSDSTTGITSVIEGVSDIGMSSRNLTEEELQNPIKTDTIGYDGLAVIVNNQNPIDNLTKEQVRKIYQGDYLNWEDLSGESDKDQR